MRSLKHINAYLFLHGKPVSKGAVDKFLSILQDDIKSGKITKAKDKYTKEVDRIQRSLVGMSNVMFPDEVAKVEIEAPRKKHYEAVLAVQGLNGFVPVMISGAAGKVTEYLILKLFKSSPLKGLSGTKITGKGSRDKNAYNKMVDSYKWYVVYMPEKKVITGFESKDDCKQELKDNGNEKDKDYKIIAKSALKKFGIEIPNEKWKFISGVESIEEKKNEIISFLENKFGGKVTAKKNVGSMKEFLRFTKKGSEFFPFPSTKEVTEFGKELKAKFGYSVYINNSQIDIKLLGGVSGIKQINKLGIFKKGDKVFVNYGNFGEGVIINNGRKNTFNPEEKIYKVLLSNSETVSVNELHFAEKSISGIKADEKKLRKSVKAKGIRLTHGYKLAKRKKGVTKKVTRKVTPKKVAPKKAKKVAVKKTVAKKLPTVKVIPAKKHSPGKAIAPKNNKVKASVTAAIADLITLPKYEQYGAMFLGMFYSTFKNTDHVDRITGDMKEKMFEKYDFDLFESGENFYFPKDVTLTSKGKELIKSIEGRINTLKAKKSGTDLFPELGSTKGPKTISETVDQVLGAMKAERSGVKTVNAKKHNTHNLPVYRQVEVMPVQNTPSPVTSSHVQTSTVKTEGTMSGAEMGQMTFEKLNFNDYYKGIFGSPATNFDMCIDGSPGSGKTTFLLMFGNYLADFHGPTLFVTTEEFGSATLIDKINRFNIKSKNIRFAKKVPEFDELKKYKFIFIDSINHAKITIEQYQAMREKAPKTAFILVLQQTKGGTYKGSTDWPHEVEITMSLFKNEFDERMLKISKDRYTDPVPRVVKI